MPIAALVGGLTAAGGTAAAGALESGGASSGQQSTLNSISSYAVPTGETNVNAGTSALNQSLGYYESLAEGGQAATQAEGPQISSLASQYRQAANQISQFAPRGGGTSSTLEQAPYNLAGQITSLLQTGQQTGASAVANIGQSLLSSGINLLGTGSGAASSSGSLALSSAQLTDQVLGSLGSSLGTLLGAEVLGGNLSSGTGNLSNIFSQLLNGGGGGTSAINVNSGPYGPGSYGD